MRRGIALVGATVAALAAGNADAQASAAPVKAGEVPPNTPPAVEPATAEDVGSPSPPPLSEALPGHPDDTQADEATDPLPARTQIQVNPQYSFPNGNTRYQAELLFQTILPYWGVWIPGTYVPGFWSIARVRLPAQSQQIGDQTASGLSDLMFTDLAARAFGPINIGLGFGSIFPMATNPALGQGKIQLGPALGLRIPIEGVRLAALVQNFYSVAGSSQSPNLAYVTVQPFLTVDLPSRFFLSSDAIMTFAWKGANSSVPLNLGFGRAFGAHFVGSLEYWYTVAEANQGQMRVRAVLNFQP